MEVIGNSKPISENHPYRMYPCRCSCGKELLVRKSCLVEGSKKSCGCLTSKMISEARTTHGLSKHPLFQTWLDMNRRCSDKKRKDFKHYGGRGIVVCARWQNDEGIKNFIEDMLPSYQKGLELERVDVNGNYEPSNCKWVSHRQQVINRRPNGSSFDTKMISYKGKTQCLSEWADELNINRAVLSDRLCKLGWSVEKAFTYKIRPREILVEIDNIRYKLSDIFKYPSNAANLASRLKISTSEYIFTLFKNIGIVILFYNKQYMVFDSDVVVDIYKYEIPPLKEEFKKLLDRFNCLSRAERKAA